MSNIRKIIYLVIFLLINVVYAFQITPSTITTNVIVNETKSIYFTIKNIENFTFYNITIITTPYYLEYKKLNLEKNESKEINLNITVNSNENYNNLLTFRGYYLVNTTQQQNNYNVNATPLYFTPSSLTINMNDVVNFYNDDNITHTIYCPTFFTQTILPHATYSHQFANINSIICVESIFNYNLNLNIVNQPQALAYNSIYDSTLNLIVNSNIENTNIKVEFDQDNFDIAWNKVEESFLKITNLGSEVTDNLSISASSNFISLSSYDKTIEAGDRDIVLFDISPRIIKTSETNKTYDIVFTIAGRNFDTKYHTIKVYVPYKDLSNENFNNTADWWIEWKDFCNLNPKSPFCLSEPIIKYIYGSNASDYNLTINVTAQMYYELNRRILEYGGEEQGFWTWYKEEWALEKEKENTVNEDLLKLINETYTIAMKNKEDLDESRMTRNFLIVIIIIILSVIILFGGIYYYKKKKLQTSNIFGES